MELLSGFFQGTPFCKYELFIPFKLMVMVGVSVRASVRARAGARLLTLEMITGNGDQFQS